MLDGKRDLTAKVADFGMAREMDDEEYTNRTMNPVGPLKWMAPEQMHQCAYSKASDVFSFGVVLYEMFHRQPPWSGKNNLVVANNVMNGERMKIDRKKTPRDVRKLMQDCWLAEPKERPNIKQVRHTLHELMETSSSES